MAIPRPTPALRTGLQTLVDSIPALRGGAVTGDREVVVSGVTLDSRAVRPGDLYAALPGTHAHGATYAVDLVGTAAAVLTDAAGAAVLDARGVDLPRIVVEHPRSVLGEVAAVLYGTTDLPLTMIGITGTNGKTTTAYLVSCALAAMGRRSGLIGTVETRIGDERIKSVRTTPEATDLHALLAVMAERGMDDCVMEVSSHALVQHRVDGVVYDLALFTNLSQDHLDFHATMADYFAAKASLFTPLRARRGLVCVDDDWGRRLATRAEIPVVTLASHPGVPADWHVHQDGGDPARFTLTGPTLTLRLRSALPGDFNIVNTAMAAVALIEIGESRARVESAILTDPHVPGRMEQVTASRPQAGPTTVATPRAVVDYAHTPEAVAAALAALRPTTPGRLVVVLGAGGDRDRGKRPAMGRAAAEHADVVIITDDNPRSEDPAAIRAALLEAAHAAPGDGAHRLEVAGRAAAIRVAVAAAAAGGPGSTVAVVGKGHETGQEVGDEVHPFDDRVELRAALDDLVAGDLAPEDPR